MGRLYMVEPPLLLTGQDGLVGTGLKKCDERPGEHGMTQEVAR